MEISRSDSTIGSRSKRELAPTLWVDARAAVRSIDAEMSSQRDEGYPGTNARENRRWLIGIGISLVFGVFGAVMALLSYSERTKSPATGASVAPRASPDRAAPGRRKDRGRD